MHNISCVKTVSSVEIGLTEPKQFQVRLRHANVSRNAIMLLEVETQLTSAIRPFQLVSCNNSDTPSAMPFLQKIFFCTLMTDDALITYLEEARASSACEGYIIEMDIIVLQPC